MSIEIIKEAPIKLTAGEYHALRHQYDMAYMFYSGPIPTFEEYVRRVRSAAIGSSERQATEKGRA